MKVKFNLPSHRYNSSITFDNNTTFGFGNLQPLFCKFVLPKSKFSCTINQLTRLSPLVVPTFARLKQINDFVYVNINKVMPSFDAFLSNSRIEGVTRAYTPNSLPCTTNYDLFCDLIAKYAWVNSKKKSDNTISNHFYQKTVSGSYRDIATVSKVLSASELSSVKYDFKFASYGPNGSLAYDTYVKLTQRGRYWYTLLRGLGFSLDVNDTKPVSILPLWAFAKAYYDLYYPKRYNPWHSSNYYAQINAHYNGNFTLVDNSGSRYDMIPSEKFKLQALFGSVVDFVFYGALDNDVIQAALSTPLNTSISQGSHSSDGLPLYGQDFIRQENSNIPNLSSTPDGQGITNLSADGLSLVNRLWSFVSRSSVVGQSVKDWFKVHFGIQPSEDMFDTSVCFAQKPNFININSVVSNSDTKSGTSGARLGDLAGQALSNVSDKVSFDVPNFGFVFCISGVIPLTRVSGGTQCELYNTRYFDMPFPDFDGLGYETINNSSFVEPFHGNCDVNNTYVSKGYGYVPRFTSYKTYNNVRSGGFSLPSIQDTYLSYCEDTIVDTRGIDAYHPLPTPESLMYFFPWRFSGSNFLSYDRIFYNQFTRDNTIAEDYIDDNFMCQSAFEFNISSYLKPISDSYSIFTLGKQLVSVKRQ